MEQMTPPPPPMQTQSTQTTCQWCTKPMESTAVRCPGCGKLRKDIFNKKIICYIACGLGGLLIGIGISKMGGHKQNDLYDQFYNQGGGSGSTGTILLVAGIAIALVGIYFWYKVSQQLKTWWWS